MPKSQIPLIKVIEWRKNKLTSHINDAHFYLEQDNWNDYNFYTSYHLHVSGALTENGDPALIGHLRILKLGQREGQAYLLKKGSLEALSEEFCSMATSLDYYERLAQLPEKYRTAILTALRDIIIDPTIKEDFINELGFRKSLMRNIPEDDEIFDLAPLLITRDFNKLLQLNLSFSFSIPEIETPIEFTFDSPTYGWNDKHLPNRISVLIGRNGSGKSTLLSRISRIAFSSATVRRNLTLKKVGQITPPGLGFSRVILLSYSAFDAFNTPGIYKSDKQTIVEEMKNGLGRYVFCGIRDIVTELSNALQNIETDKDGKLNRQDILNDRTDNTKLKSIKELSVEFVRNINIISASKQQGTLIETFDLLRQEHSMYNLLNDNIVELSDKDKSKLFMQLSTGHKFVIHAITSIVAYAAPRSLLLFDEPETHLHPPILAALMKAIRHVLNKINAFMIVATHSPVILQETLRKHIYVVRREGNSMQVSQPDIETFGENIGVLTQVAFGLTADITDYHDTLDDLVKEYSDEIFTNSNPEEILSAIESKFDIGLSMQARSYILSKIYKDKQ